MIVLRYSKTCLKRTSKIDKTKVLIANCSLRKAKNFAEYSPWSILQYFWQTLSENLSWKLILVFFSSGSLWQVLLYYTMHNEQQTRKYKWEIHNNRSHPAKTCCSYYFNNLNSGNPYWSSLAKSKNLDICQKM